MCIFYVFHSVLLQNQLSSETLTSVDSYMDGGRSSESVFGPKLIEGLSGVTITHVSCGDLFAAVLTGKMAC